MERGPSYSITDLAKEFGVTLRTLRFYEQKGLIKPERRGTTRVYSDRDRACFRQIHAWAEQGFSLREIKRALVDGGFDRNQLSRQLTEMLERRAETDRAIAALERQVA